MVLFTCFSLLSI
uniref:Uncharacterized protein n=1 Tax=Gallus gallus TaxID=9031 RepID=Q5ZLY9_CHICK|nr:hypothetical protein RCJMB04_4f2 [Gallus gallus]